MVAIAAQLRLPGIPPDRFGVQGVRADDADPRLRRQPERHLLHVQAAGRPDGRRWRPPGRSTPTTTCTTATSTSRRPPYLSDNTVFAQLVVDLGVAKMNQIARAMGITSPLATEPVGGARRAHLRHHAAADGRRLRDDRRRRRPPQGDDHQQDRAGPTAARPLLRQLQGHPRVPVQPDVRGRPGAQAGADRSGRDRRGPVSWGCPAAGKTGTAENLANAWFVGYTPQISTGVWVGYPQGNIPINDGFGGHYAGPIWKDYMESASDGYCGDWTAPPVPFAGTAFTGPNSSSGPASSSSGAPPPCRRPAQTTTDARRRLRRPPRRRRPAAATPAAAAAPPAVVVAAAASTAAPAAASA